MPMNELKKAAEILVECGYADNIGAFIGTDEMCLIIIDNVVDNMRVDINPFADTLEGRRQADAIEDYLWDKREDLWDSSYFEVKWSVGGRKMRLDRIKRCLQELIK